MWSADGRCVPIGGVDPLAVLPAACQVPQHGAEATKTAAALDTTGRSVQLEVTSS